MFSSVTAYVIVFHYVTVVMNVHVYVMLFSAPYWNDKSGAM